MSSASDSAGPSVTPGTETPSARAFTVVLMSDLGADERLGRVTEVDKDDFAKVLAAARPTLRMAIKTSAGEWEFELAIDAMKMFEPAGFLTRIDGARWRLAARQQLMDRRAAKISADDLNAALRQAATADSSLAWLTQPVSGGSAAPAAPKPAGGANILDMVDEPDDAARVSAEVGRIAESASDPTSRISGNEATTIGSLLARLDRELAEIANAVLKTPEFRKIETAWRGAKYLVDHFDFRAGVRLSLLHAEREAAAERLAEQIVDPAFQGDAPTPGLIVFDYAIGNNPQHFALLDSVAQSAVGLPTPVTFPIEPSFFDIKSLRLLKNLPALPGLVDSFQFAKWKSLRDQAYTRVLAPVVGGFVLRAPHEPRSDARDYTCKESVSSMGDLLWGGGHIALAVCAARSVERHGWPTRMFGAEAGKIADLPLVPNPNDPQSPWGPGDLSLPDRRMDELPAIGMNGLLSVTGKDHCILIGGVSAARPVVTQDVPKQQAMLEVSLPYQQVSNIVSAWLCEQLPTLRGLPADQIQQKLIMGLAALMKISKVEDMEAVQVGVGNHPESPGQTLVQIQLAPPATIAPEGLTISFGFAV